MKDNLFEMLMNLFEQSLSQLQKNHEALENPGNVDENPLSSAEHDALYVKSAHSHSIRVLTYEEQMKMTKSSYQFLMRMKLWNIIDVDLFETVMHHLQHTESRIITLEETKWAIRKVLEPILTEEQLTFLDLVLYHTEDAVTSH